MKLLISIAYIILIVFSMLYFYRASYGYPAVFDDYTTYSSLNNKSDTCNTFHTACGIAKDIANTVIHNPGTYSPRWIWNASLVSVGNNIQCQRKFNVLLNILVSISVYFYFLILFSIVFPNNGSVWTSPIRITLMAILASTFFIFNPVSIYAVAYIAQRTICMATLFSMLALTVYIIALNSSIYFRIPLCIIAVPALYQATIMGKEHAALLPIVLFVHWLFFYNKTHCPKKQYIIEGVFSYGLFLLIAGQFISHRGPLTEPHAMEAILLFKTYTGIDLTSKIQFISSLSQCKFYFLYVLKWLFPVGLSIDLKYPILTSWRQGYWFLIYALYPIVSIWLLLKQERERSLLGLGLLIPWIFNLVEVGTHCRIAEQFVLYRSYLWMPCFFSIIPFIIENIKTKNITIITAVCITILSYGYMDHIKTFESERSVWDNAKKQLPELSIDRVWGSIHVLNSLGVAEQHEGNVDTSLKAYDEALKIDPDYDITLSNKATALIDKKNFFAAKQLLFKALMIKPDEVSVLTNLGVVEHHIGNYKEAKSFYDRVLQKEPDNIVVKYDMNKLNLDIQQRGPYGIQGNRQKVQQ